MSDETTQTTLFKVRLRVDTENGSASGALPEVQQPVLEQTKEKRCNRCGIELTAENWPLYRKKYNVYWCGACSNKYSREKYRRLRDRAKSSVQESGDYFAPRHYRYIRYPKDSIPVCYECGVTLGDDNWYPSDRKSKHRQCTNCHNERTKANRKEWIKRPGVKERLKLQREQWLKDHPSYMRLWKAQNRPPGDIKHTDRFFRRKYGITLEDAVQMADRQEWRCAICRERFEDVPYRHGTAKSDKIHYFFMVDHDHLTGAVRGLLCHNCNHMLGRAKDNSKILRAAADYIDRDICQKL